MPSEGFTTADVPDQSGNSGSAGGRDLERRASKAKIDWDDLNADKSYIKTDRYGGSKLANALFFFELDRRLRAAKSPVTAIGVHPGVASTSLGRHMGLSRS